MHVFEEGDRITVKNEKRVAAKAQELKVEAYLEKCQIRNTEELLSVTDLEHTPKDILIDVLKIARPHRAKLNHFVQYVNDLSKELTSRGYNSQKLLSPLI
jgi:hypothetical protein